MTENAADELAGIAEVLMTGANSRWWLTGGVALAVSVGSCWRDHSDIDIATLYGDALDTHLELLESRGALEHDGKSRRYTVNLFTRRVEVEFLLSPGDDTHWVYRQDPALRVEWEHAVKRNARGVPYLAPELVLLSKSRSLRPHDHADARAVIPTLNNPSRMALAARLETGHPWIPLLNS